MLIDSLRKKPTFFKDQIKRFIDKFESYNDALFTYIDEVLDSEEETDKAICYFMSEHRKNEPIDLSYNTDEEKRDLILVTEKISNLVKENIFSLQYKNGILIANSVSDDAFIKDELCKIWEELGHDKDFVEVDTTLPF